MNTPMDIIRSARMAAELKLAIERAKMELLEVQEEAKKARQIAEKERKESEKEWEKELATHREHIKKQKAIRHNLTQQMMTRKKGVDGSGISRKNRKHNSRNIHKKRYQKQKKRTNNIIKYKNKSKKNK